MTKSDREFLQLSLIVVIVYAAALIGIPPIEAGQINHPRGTATIECVVAPTPQEDQEGYFPCGTSRHVAISINVDPSSDLATFLRAKVGQSILLTIQSAPKSR